ncbi:MAG: ATP-binding protein, partial [Candidatus Rokuibacteriota bacterium]
VKTLPAICTTSPLRDPDGTVLGAVAVFSDLTPLKELEVERRRAERLAYFEVLASGLAHEIKNPLVAIKTFTQLLPRRRNDDRFIDDFGRVAAREMERMERLLERLRTLSRPGDRPRHPLDVRAPIREALEALQPACDEKNISMTASLGGTPCIVRGDHGELEQLFLNLLMNAHEATPPGGALMIDLVRTDEHVAVTVGDTGPGIPADLLERVFDPFFTTKQRGSGLGLTICAGIAQTHGARLRAGNRAGGGASLSVEFSLAHVPAPVAG